MLQQVISQHTFHVASHNSKRDAVVIQYKGKFLDERTKVRNFWNPKKKRKRKEHLQTADKGASKQLNDFFIQLLQLSTYLVQL